MPKAGVKKKLAKLIGVESTFYNGYAPDVERTFLLSGAYLSQRRLERALAIILRTRQEAQCVKSRADFPFADENRTRTTCRLAEARSPPGVMPAFAEGPDSTCADQ